MKKLFVQALLAFPVWFMLGGISFAMCIWFVPPSRQFSPATNMKTLISREGSQLTMTVQPQFSGDATDFALVMPFPSEPTVEEAPEDIFTELEDLTNPLIDFGGDVAFSLEASDGAATRDQGVRIIEERDVGDFSTVTLSATDESALVDWLTSEGYEITDAKKDIIAKYVSTDGYFVALKVNMDKAEVSEAGVLEGELKPLSFVFESDTTSLPLQLMSGDNSLVTLTVYTLADEIAYIPGAEIQFSKKVDASQLKDAPSLESYDSWQKWLVRNVVQVETEEITQDLQVLSTVEKRVVVPEEVPIVLNPDKLERGTGVVVSDNGVTIYTDETSSEPTVRETAVTSTAATTAIILLAISNVVLLAIVTVKHNAAGATTPKK